MSQRIPLTRGAFVLVDDADYGWLTQWRWRLNSHGYAIRSIYVEEHEVHFSMHRVIMNAQRGQFVDHIDHNRLNNTRANLRFVTFQENLRYRRCFANNPVGFKGVSPRKRRWQARIGVDERIIHLAYFDTPEMAAQAYDAAAKRVFGEFALLNRPDHETPPDVEAGVEAALARCGLGS